MRDIIVLLIVAGILPFAIRRPYLGIMLWCWIGYMNPHRLAYGFAYNFPFAAIIAGVTIVALIISRDKKNIPWYPLTIAWILLVIWMSVTTVFAMVPDEAVSEWSRTIKIQFMTLLTILIMNTRTKLDYLIWIIVVSLGFWGIKGGIFTLLTGGNYMVFGPKGSFISGNNSLALALVMTLPLMRYLQLQTRRIWVRHGLTIAMVLSAFSIVASYSRGAFVAIAAMGATLLLKSRKRAIMILAALILVPVMYSFMPDKWFERIETIQHYDQDRSVLGRFNAWWFAYNVAKEKPLTGGGMGVFDQELFERYAPEPENFHDAHSIYFEMLGEQGFIGLALFLMLGLLALRSGRYIIRNAQDNPDLYWARDLAAMVQVSIIGYAVGGAFLGLAYFDLYYHLIAIVILTRFVIDNEISSRAAEISGVEKQGDVMTDNAETERQY